MGAWILILAGLTMALSIICGRMMPRLGLALSPFLSAAVWACIMTALGEGSDSDIYGDRYSHSYREILAAMGGILNILLTMLAVLMSKVVDDGPNWAQTASKVTLIVLALLVGAALATGLLGGLGLLMALMMFVLVIRFMLISRNAFCAHVFSTLGAAMRQGLPLTTALEAESDAVQGKARWTLRRISHLLTEGLPLSDALRLGYHQCPGYALGMVAAAEQVHQLPRGIARIEQQLVRQSRDYMRIQPVNVFYPFVVILFEILVLGGLITFVFPTLKKLCMNMGAPLPALTRWVFIAVPRELGVIVPILLIAIAGLCLYAAFRRRDPRHPKSLSYVGDFAKWRLPVSYWFEKNYALLQTVSFLRMALASGSRVDLAIAEAAELDVNLCYRSKLRDWLQRVQCGQNISAAAAASGVGKSLQWAFDEQANPGQTLGVLKMLESSYEAVYSYKANLARFIFWPGVTIALACMVGTLVLALFLPLIGLIQAVMNATLP